MPTMNSAGPVRVGATERVHRREPLVVVLVPDQDHVHALLVEQLPQRLQLEREHPRGVRGRAEERVVHEGERAPPVTVQDETFFANSYIALPGPHPSLTAGFAVIGAF